MTVVKSSLPLTPEVSLPITDKQVAAQAPRALPLIAIVGAAGKSTTGWLLTDIVEAAGREVGAWLSSGVYVDHKIRNDELHAWELAVLAARAREIDLLIQEIPAVLASRLAPSSLQIVITTSICGSDAACRRDEAAARERDAVIQAVRSLRPDGIAVANADDLLVVHAIEEGNYRSIFYALHEANPVLRGHLAEGGSACWIQDGWLVCSIDGKFERIVPAASLAAALDGELSYQLQNALAATAAALALGIDLKYVRDVLRTFVPDSDRLPGSSNLFETDDTRIIVDQPRSTWALKHLARAVRATTAKRVLAVTDCLLQFDRDELVEVGRLIGSSCGVVMIYAAPDEEDRVEALREGLAASELPPIILARETPLPSLAQVQSMLQPGDTGLVLLGPGQFTPVD